MQDSKEQEFRPGEICNRNEIELVNTIIQVLEQRLIGLNISVITPYQYQKREIEKRISHIVKKNRISISVNTIDAFQVGRFLEFTLKLE